MEFNRAMKGLANYIEKNLYPAMNDAQELMARMFVARTLNSADKVKALCESNPMLKTFNVFDEVGGIDIENLLRDLKEQISAMGKVKICLKLMPEFTFSAGDVDELYRMIKGEDL
jgi:hypothetical protein